MARKIAERSDIVPVLGEIFRERGFAGASLGSMHIDELLISAAYITDFSDGYIPEPAHGALAGWGLLCACRAARRAVR